MKKFLSVMIAVVLAVVFSAFTATKPVTEVHGHDGSNWHTFDASFGCPDDGDVPCTVDNPNTPAIGDMVDVYTQKILSDEFRIKYDD